MPINPSLIKNKYNKLMNSGMIYASSDFDKRIIKYFNLICFYSLFLFIPIIVITNILEAHYEELLLLLFITVVFLLCWRLNLKGKTQQGLLLFVISSISVSHVVVHMNTVQTPAPYIALGIGLMTLLYIKNKWWSIALFIYGFLSFAWLNYFQITTRVFDASEYVIILLIILVFAQSFRFVNAMRNKYEIQVVEQNKALKKQNEIIQQKSEELITMEKEKNEQNLLLQQKDMEMVLANNMVQIQMNESLIAKLTEAKNSEIVTKAIKAIIVELKHQNEINIKMNLIQENMNVVNMQFFDRLLQKHPTITRTDKEFCSYIRLGLSTKEIAVIRNTTINTINVAKTRLRKKLGLLNNKDLSVYLSSV